VLSSRVLSSSRRLYRFCKVCILVGVATSIQRRADSSATVVRLSAPVALLWSFVRKRRSGGGWFSRQCSSPRRSAEWICSRRAELLESIDCTEMIGKRSWVPSIQRDVFRSL